jgi:hypothetical protein
MAKPRQRRSNPFIAYAGGAVNSNPSGTSPKPQGLARGLDRQAPPPKRPLPGGRFPARTSSRSTNSTRCSTQPESEAEGERVSALVAVRCARRWAWRSSACFGTASNRRT